MAEKDMVALIDGENTYNIKDAKAFRQPTTTITTGSADDLTAPGIYALGQNVVCRSGTGSIGGATKILQTIQTANADYILQVLYTSYEVAYYRYCVIGQISTTSFIQLSTNIKPYGFIVGPTWWFDGDSRDFLKYIQDIDTGTSVLGILDDPITGTGTDYSWYMLYTNDSEPSPVIGIVNCNGVLYQVTIAEEVWNLTEAQLEDRDYCEAWANNRSNIRFTPLSKPVDTTQPDSAGSLDLTSYFTCQLTDITGSIMENPTVKLYKNGKIHFQFTLNQSNLLSANTFSCMAHLYAYVQSDKQSALKTAVQNFLGESAIAYLTKRYYFQPSSTQSQNNPSSADIAMSTPSYISVQSSGSVFSITCEATFLAWALTSTEISGFNTYIVSGNLFE